MKGWEIPAAILEVAVTPIDKTTPIRQLRTLRDEAALCAGTFPFAELARQALDLAIGMRDPAEPADDKAPR